LFSQCYEYEKNPLRNLQTFTRQNQTSPLSFHHIQDVKKIVWICHNVLCKWDFGPTHNIYIYIYMFNKLKIYNSKLKIKKMENKLKSSQWK